MPRYYFNTRIGDELVADPEGEDLRNPDRAWEVARAMIRELLKTDGAERALLNATIEVTDDEGEIVLEFPFSEAILDLPDELGYQALAGRLRAARTIPGEPRYTGRAGLFRGSLASSSNIAEPGTECFRLRSNREISESTGQESHPRRPVLARASTRLPYKGEDHS